MKKIFLICVISLSLFGAYVAPMSVQGSTYVDSKAAFDLFNQGVKFLDVRPQNSIARGKIRGAIEMYVGNMNPQMISMIIKKDEPVVVYCNGQHCSLTPEAINLMKNWGYSKLYYYRDGYPAWNYYNLPTE
jgi:rhodanese-related sulfurtransferase